MILKKGIAVWGTGKRANALMNTHPELKPLYFIDNDKNKCEKQFLGCQVKHPDLINDFSEIHIIIANSYYESIACQLSSMGLKEHFDYISDEMLIEAPSEDSCEKSIRKNIEFIKNNIEAYRGRVLFFFCLTAYDAIEKGLGKFLLKWSQIREASEFILAQEATWLSQEENNNIIPIPVLKLPRFMGKGRYPHKRQYIVSTLAGKQSIVEVSYQANEKMNDMENQCMKNVAQGLRMKYPDMADGYETFLVHYITKYIQELFEHTNPRCIYLWNEFYPIHQLIKYLAKNMNINIKYMEYGNIPGTIQVDDEGQMGESFPATHPKEFMNQLITVTDLEYARKAWHYLYLSKENRKKQPKCDLWKMLKEKLNFGKPIVLYAGQNDYESGLQPYTVETRDYHSPIFQSSDEAALEIARICDKNGWNFIYKPHPIMCRGKVCENFTYNTILVKNSDINDIIDIADVVVTVLSTSAYVALIRKKPVVMLGYTHLKDSGCAYQAFTINMVETALMDAVKYGFTVSQREKFLQHLALLNKYYLYNDLNERPVVCGRRIGAS